mgnify:CR=1 FL=1
MNGSRRDILRATGTGLGALALGGLATSTSAATDLTDDWRPADDSNFEYASRGPSDVRWIVVHTIEGSYEGCISWFQNPDSNVSSHYVVGNQPDQTTKMVRLDDVAWTQGNGPYNDTGVSIELEGYADETEFDDAIYQQTADIIRYVCDAYDVPAQHPTYDLAPCSASDGQGGVIGHEQVPSPYDCDQVTGGKQDPGSTFDWDYLMSLVNDDGDGGGDSDPTFADGDVVHNTVDLNTREQPGTDAALVDTIPAESPAEIVNGPVDEDGYTWWGLHWTDQDVWGWSVEQYLDADTPQRFVMDELVETTADVYVREQPGLDATAIKVMPASTDGQIVNGPVDEDRYTWWGVHFTDGEDLWAWCPGEFLGSR